MRALLICLLAVCCAHSAQARNEKAGLFDYYVLALSWSPTFCRSPAGRRNQEQCSPGRRYAFVVHGLWPQYRQGWPSFCSGADRWVSRHQIRSMFDIMPSKGLIIHQWKKHGSCSGLDQAQYFEMTRTLFDKIRIPARYLSPTDPVTVTPRQLVADFLKTNRTLEADMVSVHCGNGRATEALRELRICFNRKGDLTACGSNERRQCRAESLIMPPVR
jgi:ribonuclease T2